MNLLKEQFDTKYDFPEYNGNRIEYVIASTPRSGSHMLGHLLKETSLFGYPLEYFHQNHLPKWKQRFKTDDLEQTVKEIKRWRTSTNGVFGTKLHFEHTPSINGVRNLSYFFPNAKYIILSRKNIVKQAVSYALATQTGVWFEGVPPKADAKVEYDYDLIDSKLRNILTSTNSWRYTLATQALDYIELNYEDILQRIPEHVDIIGKFLGIKIPPNTIPSTPTTTKQSNPISKVWTERFIEDSKNRSAIFDPNYATTYQVLKILFRKVKLKIKHFAKH